MRKIISIILCLTMLLPLCACEQGKEIKLLENTDYEDGATTLYYLMVRRHIINMSSIRMRRRRSLNR